jgi:hypothetical protein
MKKMTGEISSKKNDWKKVEEQTPAIGEHVLVMGLWKGEPGRTFWSRPSIASWSGRDWIPDTDDLESEIPFDVKPIEQVTHWMPLPQGPEEVCSNE